jgi:NarL family two-component system response regulator LiaR
MILSDPSANVEIVGLAADGAEAVRLATRHRPDVVVMDLVMPRVDGIEATRQLVEAGIGTRVLILTSFTEDLRVGEAIRAGATGYLMKDVVKRELVAAIHAAAAGAPTLHPRAQQQLLQEIQTPSASSPLDVLTPRERDVLRLIASGASNKVIAAQLYLSLGTVKGYVSSILEKLGVGDRTQAALLAVKHGIEGNA